MWMLLLVAYGQRDPNAYFLTQHIRQSFAKDISDSMSIQDVFNWANTTLLSNLFGEYPGQYAVQLYCTWQLSKLKMALWEKNKCFLMNFIFNMN